MTDPGAADTPAKRVAEQEPAGERRLADTFDRIVEEGKPRLHRPWPDLLATASIAGIEVSIGVLAYVAVEDATGSHLLAGVAFSFGFVALLLGHSELFTEGFLVPVAVVAAGEASALQMARLWLGTAVGNLAGGWVLTAIAMTAYPQLGGEARSTASYFINSGITWRSLCMAILAGVVITLMTRMNNGTESMPARLVATVASAFVIAGLRMAHSILDSMVSFSAMHSGGTPFGYVDWLRWFGWAAFGNILGGIGLVTVLRLIRSRRMISSHRADTADEHLSSGSGQSDQSVAARRR